MNRFAGIVSDLLNLAWPNLCLLCDRPLLEGEKHLCLHCLYDLPKTDFKSFVINPAADRFLGKIPFEKAAAGYLYQKESSIQKVLELIKYQGEKELGEELASLAGSKLLDKGFFEDIDILMPVPLHPKKAKKRGYNQSEWIAKGLSNVSGIPLDTNNLQRHIQNPTQTTKSIWERWQNVQGHFILNNPTAFKDKHILLIDDVLTSGSTLEACGQAIHKVAEAKISFFALAMA
jgi:ComF family protein